MLSLGKIIAEIELADEEALSRIISAAARRYQLLYPDWEVMFLSFPTSTPEIRHRCREDAIKLLQKYR